MHRVMADEVDMARGNLGPQFEDATLQIPPGQLRHCSIHPVGLAEASAILQSCQIYRDHNEARERDERGASTRHETPAPTSAVQKNWRKGAQASGAAALAEHNLRMRDLTDATRAYLDTFSTPDLSDFYDMIILDKNNERTYVRPFELIQLSTLQPQTVLEAQSLIPTLNDYSDESIHQLIERMNQQINL